MLDVRDNLRVRIERSRDNVFTVTATSQELSALIAGARMALEALRAEALGAGRPADGWSADHASGAHLARRRASGWPGASGA